MTVQLTRAERDHAERAKARDPVGHAAKERGLERVAQLVVAKARQTFTPPLSHIETEEYNPPQLTKKEAEEYYRPPEGLRKLLLA